MEEIELFRDENFDENQIPTEFDLFQAMDRTSQIFQQLETALYNHPGFDAEQAALAQQASSILFEIYQRAGRRFFESEGDE